MKNIYELKLLSFLINNHAELFDISLHKTLFYFVLCFIRDLIIEILLIILFVVCCTNFLKIYIK